MISVENLTRRYGDFLAVEDVSFKIEQGEIVGLLGHNGAGKTTLMKMLTGYLEPDIGTVTISGLAMDQSRRKIQQKIGYLPENCPVYSEMTVIDYLRYAARLHGIAGKEIDGAIVQAIERTALQEKASAAISTLSRGLRQRVGVAQAILNEPQILILDEPTNGLDPSQIHHMRDLIKTLAKNATIIVSTHILQEVQAVCDRVIILRRGSKVVDSRLDELQHAKRLLIKVSSSITNMQVMSEMIDGLTEVTLLDDATSYQHYALSLNEGVDMDSVAPQVARYIHKQGGSLLAMYPETRDLESLFGQVNADEAESGGISS